MGQVPSLGLLVHRKQGNKSTCTAHRSMKKKNISKTHIKRFLVVLYDEILWRRKKNGHPVLAAQDCNILG